MKRSLITILATVASAAAAHAQQLPPVRQLGAIAATSSEPLGAMVFARSLPGGVLVNDVQSRRVLLFDSTLAAPTVVADTTSATANAYSGRIGGLIPYRADSSLFVDPQSLSMLVIDPAGKVQRVMSVPRSQDAASLGNSAFGTPALDGAGRLVYRGFPRPQFRREERGTAAGQFTPPEIPDTTPLTRVDLNTRQTDTVAFLKVPRIKFDVQRDDAGRVTVTSQLNPLPVVDDWAVLSDGSIAIVRGRDYHVDFVRADGTLESAPKIPFEWRRLTDEDKVAFIDSVKAVRERMGANANVPFLNGAPGGGNAGPGAGGPPGEVRVFVGGPGAPGGPGAGGPGGRGGPQMSFVAPSELPDYQPVFFAGSTRADAEGNLWVRTIPTKSLPGGPIYDVINAKGVLVDRVQVPANRVIVGFGRGGIVYLLDREGQTGKLERATIR